ncbi:hypothetical protein GWG65_37910 [Bradyrhizobium sp. CSA207]|uniref:hypothetical protein n=1 Tax=Bradyrhizobium sp. CSA207 TaxID=2698826 RepID=UPI0023AFB39D|nr:hypothetical protein [Bradyrhizobium sp. CSA207]MDE5447001.1 hypothetical protein [Bradyrhizobium sp. CSA207]
MVLKKRFALCLAVVALTSSTTLPATAAPWTRGFVVSDYQFAFRYGGRPDFTRGAEIEPGADCPHGSSNHFNSSNLDLIKNALARQKWRSQQEIDWISKPPGLDQVGEPAKVRNYIWRRALAYRGYKRGIETYTNPWAAEDPGQPEVTGRIAEGVNLDGKVGPNDFVSPDGEKGIDNALYRAWGCDAPWRGNSTFARAIKENMAFGLYTMVLRISGNQNPMNDNDATVEIGYSPDKIVKDARGGIAADYSYRILKSTQYTRLKAKIKNGVVETAQEKHLHMPRIAWVYQQTGDANLINGKMRLDIALDGSSGTGLIAGYKDWRDLYAEASFYYDAGSQDTTGHQDHVALYFALRRNADGMYNETTGQYDGISTAFRIRMYSAFVVDPDKPMEIPTVAGEQWRMNGTEANKAAFFKGIETRIPQDPPPGVTQTAAYPSLERVMQKLPSRDFFLTLDRPHWPVGVGVDQFGNPIDDQGDRIDSRGNKLDEQGNPLKLSQSQHQVGNGVPATVAPRQEQ